MEDMSTEDMRWILSFLAGAAPVEYRIALEQLRITREWVANYTASLAEPTPEPEIIGCDECGGEFPEDVIRVCGECDGTACPDCRAMYGQCCERYADNWDERI